MTPAVFAGGSEAVKMSGAVMAQVMNDAVRGRDEAADRRQ
jgi:hypothetical protein